MKLETTGNENELLSERLRQSERELGNIKKEAANLQNMLQQSQAQYMALDKKYNKAKRLVREYQQRELDMCHREEFYQQLLQEKDTEYNALVKKLKDRVINLEHELQETQRKAGLPVGLPYDSATLKLTPQMMRKTPPKPLFHKLETELSDTEISDLSPDGDGVKTATVERKVPVKDELDAAVPQHELLDNSVNKTKIELGELAGSISQLIIPGFSLAAHHQSFLFVSVKTFKFFHLFFDYLLRFVIVLNVIIILLSSFHSLFLCVSVSVLRSLLPLALFSRSLSLCVRVFSFIANSACLFVVRLFV